MESGYTCLEGIANKEAAASNGDKHCREQRQCQGGYAGLSHD